MSFRSIAVLAALVLTLPCTAKAEPVYAGGEPLGQHEVETYYPPEARRAGETGEVIVDIVIGPDGSVTEATVAVSSGFFDLDEAAVAAVKRWRYTPPTSDGKPISMASAVSIDFALGSGSYLDVSGGDEHDCANSALPADTRIKACGSVIHGLLTKQSAELRALQVRAMLYSKVHREDLARADYDTILMLDPINGPSWYSRGLLSYREKKFDLAVADLTKAKRLAPRFFDAFYFSAMANKELKNTEAEIDDLNTAIALKPDEIYVVYLRLEAESLLKRYDAVAADAGLIIARNPNLSIAYSSRAWAYAQQGNFDAAIADVDKALALDPKSVAALKTRIDILIGTKKIKEALAELEKLAPLIDDKFKVYAERGVLHEYLNQHDRAVADFSAALAIKGDDARLLNGRCFARAEMGSDLDAALADCDKSLSLVPNAPEVLDSRGFVYFRLGDYAKAVADFDAALAISPKKPATLYVRGLAKTKIGDPDGGKKDIAAALAIDPKVADRYAGYGINP